MTNKNPIRLIFELLLISLLSVSINVLYTFTTGFFKESIYFYIFLSFLLAIYYGKYFGYISFGIMLLMTGGALLLMEQIIDFEISWNALAQYLPFPFVVSLLGNYIFGNFHGYNIEKTDKLLSRIRKLSKRNHRYKNEVGGLISVNRELEERVSKQHQSITTLYKQIRKLNALNVKKALEVILETVSIFAGAKRASIWQYDFSQKSFKVMANIGWEKSGKVLTQIDGENTLEGWVFRNNKLFSARMLLHYENLEKLYTGEVLLSLPLSVGNNLWGVLNIEEMPFEKYNTYTEKILQIVTDLAAPALERCLNYESLIIDSDVSSETGLPLFSHFYRFLQEEIERMRPQKGTLSIVILEIINFSDFEEVYKDIARQLILDLRDMLVELSDNEAKIFHYKEKNQLAMIFPQVDHDGISLFCLETLEKVNTENWILEDESVDLEAIISYASMSQENHHIDTLLDKAETLLTMQKV